MTSTLQRTALALALVALPVLAQEGNERALQIARTSPTAKAAELRVRQAAATIADQALRAASAW